MLPSLIFNRALIVLLLGLTAASAACTFAEDNVLVADKAELMSDEQRQRMTAHHGFLLSDHGIDYRVITDRGTGDIVAYGVEQFKAMDVGALSETGRGLLLVIDAEQDRVRLEVGLALEGVFTDAFVAYVEQRQMLPFFRAGRVADGILATTELIVTRAHDARRNQAFDAPAGTTGSGGGGATTKARIGAGAELTKAPSGPMAAAGSTPEE
ncbi:MAG TPA: TPM domain-containing protein, partial [Afifellaceae bacterium]|nr:TPM domain-containing protein [Afifellaceae bacterium]